MKTVIKYLLAGEEISYQSLKVYERFLSKERRKSIHQFRFDQDRKNALLAGLLMRAAAMEALCKKNQELVFEKGEKGKPYLKGEENYHFSLSHTGHCIGLAYGETPLGLDLEKIEEVREKIAERYYLPEEREYISNNPHKENAFYEIWTRKEAFLKMTGEGLSRALDSFCVIGDPNYDSRIIEAEDHYYSLSIYQQGLSECEIIIEKIDLFELLESFDGVNVMT